MLFFKKKQTKDNETEQKSSSDMGHPLSANADRNDTEDHKISDSFYLGVEDTFRLKETLDLVVVGKVHGTIRTGAAVYISNPGDDDAPTNLTTVVGLEKNNREMVESATDTFVGVRIEAGSKLNLKTGSVLYTRDISAKDVHDAYIHALGDGLIGFRHMKLEQADYDKLSLTDLVEVRRLYKWMVESKKEQETEEIAAFNQQVFETLNQTICKRILSVKEIYTVVNKRTGEPHMVSKTYEREDGNYVTSPPDIILITKAYLEVWKNSFQPERFDIVKIENGEDGKGIYNFLGSTFYLNGACGVTVLFNDFAIDGSMLVPKPDYSNVPPVQVPVTNPDLVRWMILLGQMEPNHSDEEDKLRQIYYGFLFRELKKAQFIVPIKMDAEMDPPDKDGKTVLKKDGQMMIAFQKGKGEKDAVRMYTDWKRLRMAYKEEEGWSGLIQPISGMIEPFDCAINATPVEALGCYVDKAFYEEFINK